MTHAAIFARLARFALGATACTIASFSAHAQSVSAIGEVRDAGNGAALRSMVVAAYSSSGLLQANATTDANGRYMLSLAAGQYRLLAYDPAGTYATQFSGDAPSFEESAPVTAGAGQVVTANFALWRGQTVSGLVLTSGGVGSGLTVSAYNLSGTRRGQTVTDDSGHYQLVLPPGSFKLAAYDESGTFAPSFFRDRSAFGDADVLTFVAAGPALKADFSLPIGARVSGIVTDAAAVPIPKVAVLAYLSGGRFIAEATSGQDGHFAVTLAPGAYRFVAVDPAFQFAAGFAGGAPSFEQTESMLLSGGQSVTSLVFRLERGGFLRGTVTDANSGAGLGGLTAAAYNGDGAVRTQVVTDGNGRFTLLLPPGDFRVGAFDSNLTFATRFYPREDSFSRAILIPVAAGQSSTLQPLALVRGGRISGAVVDAFSAVGVSGALLQAFGPDGAPAGQAIADSNGRYRLGLPAGSYRMAASDPQLRYAPSYSGGASDFDSAAVVVVAADGEQTVPFSLQRGTRVSGSVTDTTHRALGGIRVTALDRQGHRVAGATTVPDGTFVLAVAPGAYRFMAWDPAGRYQTSYFGGSAFSTATTVNVDGTGTSGLDLTLQATFRRRAVRR